MEFVGTNTLHRTIYLTTKYKKDIDFLLSVFLHTGLRDQAQIIPDTRFVKIYARVKLQFGVDFRIRPVSN